MPGSSSELREKLAPQKKHVKTKKQLEMGSVKFDLDDFLSELEDIFQILMWYQPYGLKSPNNRVNEETKIQIIIYFELSPPMSKRSQDFIFFFVCASLIESSRHSI